LSIAASVPSTSKVTLPHEPEASSGLDEIIVHGFSRNMHGCIHADHWGLSAPVETRRFQKPAEARKEPINDVAIARI